MQIHHSSSSVEFPIDFLSFATGQIIFELEEGHLDVNRYKESRFGLQDWNFEKQNTFSTTGLKNL